MRNIKYHIMLLILMGMLAACGGSKAVMPDMATPADAAQASEEEQPFTLPDIGEDEEEPAAEAQAPAATPEVGVIKQPPTDQAAAVNPSNPAGELVAETGPGVEGVVLDQGAGEKYIILNFDNTDIQTIISTFGELLGINYIIQPGITGSITVQSYSRFPTANLFEIFQNILEINGLTAIKRGEFYNIVPIDTVKTQPMDIKSGKKAEIALDSSFVTQVVPLENIKASDISNILRELMPRGANMIVYEPSNLLIITASPLTIEKFMKVIEALDVSSLDSEVVKTFVYFVENGEAKKLESILKTTYTASGPSAAKSASAAKPAASGRPVAKLPAVVEPASADQQTLPGELTGDVSITAYDDINALIIKTTPRNYIQLLQILKNIDIAPKQVLIEVIIAEVSMERSTELGLEWMVKLHSGNYAGYSANRFIDTSTGDVLTSTLTPIGDNGADAAGSLVAISSGTWNNDQFFSFFKAMASQSDLNIMATPNILAMDNKEAEIKIGKEVPTATSTTQSSEGITTSSQIQYKTVGTILTVTPHITEKNNVVMKIVVESSDLGTTTRIGSGDYPSFVTRKATTNALVADNHTLFLGGLISEKHDNASSGIPFLSRIPLIGWLFGGSSWGREKTEMFVMVTPRVIASQEDADRVSREFQKKVKIIKEEVTKIKEEDNEESESQM